MNDFELIHGLADGSLETEQKEEAQRRIESDPQLRSQYDDVVLLRTALRSDCQAGDCRAEWKQVRAELAKADRNKTVELFTARYAWQMAASLFFIIVGVGFYNRSAGTRPLHMSDLAGVSTQLSAASFSPESIAELFTRRGVDLKREQLQVTRVLRGECDGRDVMQVDLRDSHGPLRMISVSDAGPVEGTWDGGANMRYGQIGELRCVTWTLQGNAMLLIGDRSNDELAAIASGIQVR